MNGFLKRTWYCINKISSQKRDYESSEVYKSIQILWWCRHGIYRVFLCIPTTGNHRGFVMPAYARLAMRFPVSIFCLSSTSAILFHPSTNAITDLSQSVKNIGLDTYFRSQLYMEDPGLLDMEGIRINTLIDNRCLTTRTPWNQSGFSTPLKIIFLL